MLRCKLNKVERRTKGYTKRVEMLVNLLALIFCNNLKFNTADKAIIPTRPVFPTRAGVLNPTQLQPH